MGGGGTLPNFPIDPVTKKKFSIISSCVWLASTKKILNNILPLKKEEESVSFGDVTGFNLIYAFGKRGW